MTFNDILKYDLAIFPSIFPNRGAVLDHLFCVNGNGYEWSNDGTLSENQGDKNRPSELVEIEHFVGAGLHKKSIEDTEHIPSLILREMYYVRIPANIEDRLSNTEWTHWYPMSEGYNSLEKLPDNIPADWLNAAWECANLIIATGIDEKEVDSWTRTYHSRDTTTEKAKEYAIKGIQQNIDIATKALTKMTEQFPNHKFEINPIPTFDVKREVPKNGIVPWPIDGSPVNFDLIIEPFKKALQFAYNMRRKNKELDIPYCGMSIGHKDRCGCIGPEERLTAESLKYDDEDQGRDALEVILVCMAQVCIEQGRRDAVERIKEVTNRYFERINWEKKMEEEAKGNPKLAARLRLTKLIENSEGPITINQDDPFEVEAFKELNADMIRLLKTFDERD